MLETSLPSVPQGERGPGGDVVKESGVQDDEDAHVDGLIEEARALRRGQGRRQHHT